MTVGQQTDVGAASRLPVLVILAGVAPHWGRVESWSGPLKAPVPGLEKASCSLTTLPPAKVFVPVVPSGDSEATGPAFLCSDTTQPSDSWVGTSVVRGQSHTVAHSQALLL